MLFFLLKSFVPLPIAPFAYVDTYQYCVVPAVISLAGILDSGSGLRALSQTVSFPQTMSGGTSSLIAISKINMPYQTQIKYNNVIVSSSSTQVIFTISVDINTIISVLQVFIAASSHNRIQIKSQQQTWNNILIPNRTNICQLYEVDLSNRSCEFQSSFSSRNTSNNVVVLPFTSGMDISNSLGTILGYKLDITRINSNKFKFRITLLADTFMVYYKINFLVYQQGATQQADKNTFSDKFLQSSSNSILDHLQENVMAVNSSNFLLGLSAWSIPSGNSLDFQHSWNMIQDSHINISVTDNLPGRILYTYWFIIISLQCRDLTNTYNILNLERTACVSSCPIMQYADGNSRCIQCYYSCYTCTNGSNICLSCNLTRDHREFDHQNYHCICLDKYYNKGTTPQCQPCHYSCLTCASDNGKTYCITCNSTAPRTLHQSLCPCDQRFYDNGKTQACNQCHYSCFYCDGPNDNDCTRCLTSDFRSYLSNNQCQCLIKYYDGGISNCLPCYTTCLQCIGPLSSQCLTCDWQLGRSFLSGQCICGYNYYQTATNECQACHYSCLNCSGSLITQCFSCYENSHRTLINSRCDCNILYYDNNVLDCQACYYSCISCSNSLVNNCLACAQSWLRQLNSSNYCVCILQYYDAGQSVCQQCHYTCQTCTTTPTCLSCDQVNAYRIQSGLNCICKSNFYQAGVTVCGQCHSSCLTCSDGGPNNCLSCDNNVNRFKVSTSCPCGNNYYNYNQYCYPCHYSCLTCSNQGINYCITCETNNHRYIFNGNTCLCSTGFFDVGIAACDLCYSQCQTCQLSRLRCLSCQSSQNRQHTIKFTCQCSIGFYQNNVDTCPSCSYKCQTCISLSTICISCSQSNFRQIDNQNSDCLCLFTYYDDGVAMCRNCVASCQTCFGGLSNQCLTCKYDRTLTSGQCLCYGGHYQLGVGNCGICDFTCLTCSSISSTQCLSCDLSRTLSGGSCICKDGFVLDPSNICTKCLYYCKTCNPNDSTCLSCQSNNFRQLNSGQCHCLPGYLQTYISKCPKCENLCATCIFTNKTCISCVITRQLIGSQCFCQQGTYDKGIATCESCDLNCLTCLTSQIICTSCGYRYTLSGSKCICQTGFFLNNSYCQKCSQICSTCSSYTNCTMCKIGMYLSGNTCQCAGQYYLLGQQCYSCNKACMTCWGPLFLDCSSCFPGSTLIGSSCKSAHICSVGLYSYKGFCLLSCPADTYPSGNYCLSCPLQCQTCLASTKNCLSCPPGSLLQGSTCVKQCSPGYFLNSTSCLPCKTNCLDCYYDSTQLYCTRCNNPLLILNDLCYTQCPLNFFSNQLLCSKCYNLCQTCSSFQSNACLSCINNYTLKTNACQKCSYGLYWQNRSCWPCDLSCSSCNNQRCWTCQSNNYLSNQLCAPYSMYYNSNKQKKLCYHTCLQCSNSGSNDCIKCINNAGILGLPNKIGACPCLSNSIEMYEQGCSDSKIIKFSINLIISFICCWVILSMAISLMYKNWVIVQQIIYLIQINQVISNFKSNFAVGLPDILSHFRLYSLQLIARPSQAFFDRLIIQQQQQWYKHVIKWYIYLTGVCWTLVIIVYIIKKISQYYDCNSNIINNWLYSIYSQLPNRFMMLFSPLVLMLVLSISNQKIILYLVILLGQSIILVLKSTISVICYQQQSQAWLQRGLDQALVTSKSKLVNHYGYLLRIGMVVVATQVKDVQTSLIIILVMTLCYLIVNYRYSAQYWYTRTVTLTFIVFNLIINLFLILIIIKQQGKIKKGLSIAIIILLIMQGIIFIILSIYQLVRTKQVKVSIQANQTLQGMDLQSYWNQVIDQSISRNQPSQSI